MKKTGILLALAMVAGSASANLVLTDAQWANYAYSSGSGTGGTLDSVLDTAGDPGYQFTVTVDPTENWGAAPLDQAGFVIGFTGIGGVAADTWDVEIENTHASNFTQVQLVAWVDGWSFVQTGVWSAFLGVGDTTTLSWDAVGAGYSTIDAVGFMQLGTATTGTNTAISVIPEPATLGMVTLLGGGILWIRKKFMI